MKTFEAGLTARFFFLVSFINFETLTINEMKKVLGLDLGTTSIGWAIVEQAENNDEKSSIIRAGVRVNPLSSDEIG
ncbi:MAG: hypothetical protein CW341_07790, partial [Bacteroidetes bacterium]|nr:hypothetical protein [Bacteroidota bacterium]